MEDSNKEEASWENCPLATTDSEETPPTPSNGTLASTSAAKGHHRCGWIARLQRPAFRRKLTKTVGLCLATLSLGLEFGVRGPTFLDLQLITGTTVWEASAFFTAVHVGYIVGSLVGGVVYDHLSKSLALVVGVVGMGVFVAITPFCAQFGIMVTVCLLAALSAGVVDTEVSSNTSESSSSFTFSGPSEGNEIPFSHKTSTEPWNTADSVNSSQVIFSRNLTNSTLASLEDSTPSIVYYAFIIIGIIIVLTSLPMVWDYIVVPFLVEGKKICRRTRKASKSEAHKVQSRELPLKVYIGVLVWFCVFTLTHSTVEDTFISYLASSVVQQLNWSKQDGALLTSAFWICFAAARILNIFLLRVLRVAQLLTLSCVLLTFSLLGFLLASFLAVNWGVWCSTMVTGAAAAALVPASFAWLEEELVAVTGVTMSFAVLSTSLGSIVNPMVLGYLMEHYGAMWLAYMMLGEMVASLVSFFSLLLFSRIYVNRRFGTRQQRKERLLLIAAPTPGTQGCPEDVSDKEQMNGTCAL
ncbi:hypothetical protein C0Q70_10312 [Pomacea canaliculata]|uniref:Major facilitator superfamily (MFS) profile domain-containing protein n=1 Tax=Pomacea canaliculata TaxID=400727 RepID=A0A2T7PC94_POMCA|nr:hypothetical protein C0Q70_10312 [Pomacea canaliculata]